MEEGHRREGGETGDQEEEERGRREEDEATDQEEEDPQARAEKKQNTLPAQKKAKLEQIPGWTWSG